MDVQVPVQITKDTVSVKWWNHRSALCRSIRDIYMRNLYTDVKLVCEGREHWAHKFVLSACSDYFETVLVNVPFQGSITLAPSIHEKELLALLDFMYLGIVDVLQHELPSLVAAAEILMIKGLAVPYEDDDDEEESEDDTNSPKKDQTDSSKCKSEIQDDAFNKRQRTDGYGDNQSVKIEEEHFDYCPDLNQGSQLHASTSNSALDVLQRIPDQNCQVTSSNAEVNAMLKVLIGKTPRKGKRRNTKRHQSGQEPIRSDEKTDAFTCPTCQKKFQWRSNLTKHMRTHTGEKPYNCSVCTYKTSYSEALKRHMRIHTGEKPYQCEFCDYKARDPGSLKFHLKKHPMLATNPVPNSPHEDPDLIIDETRTRRDPNMVVRETVSRQNSPMVAQKTNSHQDSNLVAHESNTPQDTHLPIQEPNNHQESHIPSHDSHSRQDSIRPTHESHSRQDSHMPTHESHSHQETHMPTRQESSIGVHESRTRQDNRMQVHEQRIRQDSNMQICEPSPRQDNNMIVHESRPRQDSHMALHESRVRQESNMMVHHGSVPRSHLMMQPNMQHTVKPHYVENIIEPHSIMDPPMRYNNPM